eukprot:60255_1
MELCKSNYIFTGTKKSKDTTRRNYGITYTLTNHIYVVLLYSIMIGDILRYYLLSQIVQDIQDSTTTRFLAPIFRVIYRKILRDIIGIILKYILEDMFYISINSEQEIKCIQIIYILYENNNDGYNDNNEMNIHINYILKENNRISRLFSIFATKSLQDYLAHSRQLIHCKIFQTHTKKSYRKF